MQSSPEPSMSKPSLSESFLSEITFPENHIVWGVFSLLLLHWFFDLNIGLTKLIHKTYILLMLGYEDLEFTLGRCSRRT